MFKCSYRYGNWQCSIPPDDFKEVFTGVNSYLMDETQTERNIITSGPVQGYSTIKQVIRHDSEVFALPKGAYTGALCFTPKNGLRKERARNQKLMSLISTKRINSTGKPGEPATHPIKQAIADVG